MCSAESSEELGARCEACLMRDAFSAHDAAGDAGSDDSRHTIDTPSERPRQGAERSCSVVVRQAVMEMVREHNLTTGAKRGTIVGPFDFL